MPRRVVPNSSLAPLVVPETPTPAVMLQVRSLLAEAQALSARLAALNEVAVAMQANLNLDQVLQTFAREARWVLDFQVCSIALCDGVGFTEQMLRASAGYSLEPVVRPSYSGAIGRVLKQGQAVLLSSIAPEDEAPPETQSAVILPLRHASEIIGTVNFYARAAQAYSVDDLRIAYALAMQVGMVMQNARLLRATQTTRDELNTVLESISDAVLVIDANNCLLLLNTAMHNLLGIEASNYVGMPIHKLFQGLRHSSERRINARLLRSLREQWRATAGGTISLRDHVSIEWAAAPLAGSGGAGGFVITARDISERIELEQMRDMLTGMLVHDLRTPLTGLIMGLDLLKLYSNQASPQDFAEIVGQSRSSADRLLSLINTILDVRKMQVGRVNLEREAYNLQNLVDLALHSIDSLTRHFEIPIAIEIAPDLPLVDIDGSLVQRVLENLLSNALKFTPFGGTVAIGARLMSRKMVEVDVSDSGPGVPEQQRQHIFELYGQASNEHARRGTGIGLTFCKLAVEAHGGTIGVRDGTNGGSIFWFTLPIEESKS